MFCERQGEEGTEGRRDTPYPSLLPALASLIMNKERPVCQLMVYSGLKKPKTRGSWAIPAIQAVTGGPGAEGGVREAPGAALSQSPAPPPLVQTNKLLKHIHATRCLSTLPLHRRSHLLGYSSYFPPDSLLCTTEVSLHDLPHPQLQTESGAASGLPKAAFITLYCNICSHVRPSLIEP